MASSSGNGRESSHSLGIVFRTRSTFGARCSLPAVDLSEITLSCQSGSAALKQIHVWTGKERQENGGDDEFCIVGLHEGLRLTFLCHPFDSKVLKASNSCYTWGRYLTVLLYKPKTSGLTDKSQSTERNSIQFCFLNRNSVSLGVSMISLSF